MVDFFLEKMLMNLWDDLKNKIPEIEKKLDYVFLEKNLLLQAFVHRSFFNENRYLVMEHNERLEFLGDSVLNLIIAEYLYAKFPSFPEGKLSRMRSSIVEASSCFLFLKKLNLGEYVLLGRGERQSEGRGKETIWADAFEAIVGAIYLDSGFLRSKQFVLEKCRELIEKLLEVPPRNYKEELQDYVQKRWQIQPLYKVVHEEGPDHFKIFHVVVEAVGKGLGKGKGASKKEAEQQAAQDAMAHLA